jgi:hypothetical protein
MAADLTALCDVSHLWGGDAFLSPTGDLARVTRTERSKQRVLRRLMTNPGEYLFHPTYGGGLPGLVGTNATALDVAAIIRDQLRLEPSVAQTPAPVIAVSSIPNGLAVIVNYVALPDRQPVPLSFDVEV